MAKIWRSFPLLLLLSYVDAGAGAELSDSKADIGALGTPLTSEQIVSLFNNVRDDAEVQDALKTRAVNFWYADGRFISNWQNKESSGKVTGTWRVGNNQRCVTILDGVKGRVGKESCGAIFTRDGKYLTFNADGSVHGIHSVSPLKRRKP